MRTRTRRRRVVVGLYAAYALLMAFFGTGPGRDAALATRAAWGFMGVFAALATIFCLAGVYMAGRRIADDHDAALDERQLALRNGAYLQAYRIVGAAFVLFTQYMAFGTDLGFPVPNSYGVWSAVVWTVLLTTWMLPSSVLAWSEPDEEEDAVTHPRGGGGSAWVAALTLVVATAAPSQAQTGVLAPGIAVATFDSAWSRVARTYHDPAYRGVDWEGARAELRPRAERATTNAELRLVLDDLLGRLGESHIGVIPRDAAEALADGTPSEADAARPGESGVEVRVVEGALRVWRVDPEAPAFRTGVRAGLRVDSVGAWGAAPALAALGRTEGAARRMAELVLAAGTAARLDGPAGTRVMLVGRDPRGRPVRAAVARTPTRGTPVRFGALPEVYARLDHRAVPLSGGGCAAVIRLNVWMTSAAPELAAAVDHHRACAGMVVDLRGNAGGVAGMIMGAAGHFLADTAALGVMRTRGGTLRMMANPQRATADGRAVTPFGGRLAVLVDGSTASTSEFFAAGMQHLGRARVFGQRSAGQALPALMSSLPNGDVLMHPFADYVLPGGARIEGRGVQPDVLVPLRLADLAVGRDAPLEAALAWIAAP